MATASPHALAGRSEPFAGRVSFLPLAGDRRRATMPLANLRRNRLVQVSLLSRVRQPGEPGLTPEHPGLVAPAEQLVSCEHPELADLPAQLLGRTLIVRDLATARAIAAHAPGFRLVTLQGELLEPDGTLTVGTHHAETGILSRKSELRELRDQVAELDARIVELERDLADLRDRVLDAERQAREEQEQIDVLTEQAADLRGRVQRHRDRRQGLHEEVAAQPRRNPAHRRGICRPGAGLAGCAGAGGRGGGAGADAARPDARGRRRIRAARTTNGKAQQAA